MIDFKNFMRKFLSFFIVLMTCFLCVACNESMYTQTNESNSQTIATIQIPSTTKNTTTQTSIETTKSQEVSTKTTTEITTETTLQTITTEKSVVSSSTETTEREYDYVLNINSMKFHYPSCPAAQKISAHNRKEYHGTREFVIQQGYDSCGICDP